MAVIAFVRSEPDVVVAPTVSDSSGKADSWLRLYGRTMKLCFIFVLASWVALQIGCLLSLFLHFRSGIVVGTIDGSLAFKFWPVVDYFVPTHALANEFSPKTYPLAVSIAFTAILIVASAPFCASLAVPRAALRILFPWPGFHPKERDHHAPYWAFTGSNGILAVAARSCCARARSAQANHRSD